MTIKQGELVDENIPQSDEKQLFRDSIQIARDKLKEAVLQCATISVARSLSNEAIQEINKAIVVYATYMSNDLDVPVPMFVEGIAIASIASRSVLNAFLAYAREKKSISVDYAQFCVDVERREEIEPTQTTIGLDVGLNHFYTDSKGQVVENPRLLRKSERQLKKLQRKVSKRKKGSANRRKAIKRLAKKHLQVSRQRKDFVVKTARCVVRSNDLIAYEDLQVRNMVKNHKLAKSISDASWSMFRLWIEYFGKVFGKVTVAVPPHYTSQNCSNCGTTVKKSLSERTHQCSHCCTVLDRDHNAALNILAIGLNRVGHTQISTPVESSTSAS